MNRKKICSIITFVFIALICFAKGERVSASDFSYGIYTQRSTSYDEKTGGNVNKDVNDTYLCGQTVYLEIGTKGQQYMDTIEMYVDGTRLQTILTGSDTGNGYFWAWHEYTFNTAGTHKVEWKGKLVETGKSFSYSKTVYVNKIEQNNYSQYNFEGSNVTCEVTISGGNTDTPYSYQWYCAKSENGTLAIISGATEKKYTVTVNSSNSGRYYYCIVSNYNGKVTQKSKGFMMKLKYQVNYDANGGSGAPVIQTKNQGIVLKLSNSKPTRVGYTFLGWSSNRSATVPGYQAGANYTSDQSTTLYAVWKSVAASATSLPVITDPPVKSNKSSKEKKISKVTGVKAEKSYEKSSDFCYRKAVRLTWKPVSAEGFYIYRREGKLKEKKIAVISSENVLQYWDDKVKIGANYTYRVKAYKKGLSGKILTGNYSKGASVKIGTSMKSPKIKGKIENIVRVNKKKRIKKTILKIQLLQIEGQKYESQYRWINEKKWKKQKKIQGNIKNKIINKTLLGKNFMLRIRGYYYIKGKKIRSKWSNTIAVK